MTSFISQKALPNWTVKIFLILGRYFLMMLKKKEALFQNKQTPSMPAVAYYMLLINIDLA